MINKSGSTIDSTLDRASCNTEDYDGDGDSNFAEQSKSLTKKPCPCDSKNSQLSWGYVPKATTFNLTNLDGTPKTNADTLGPYALFNPAKEKELIKLAWISEYDLSEMEDHLVMLRMNEQKKDSTKEISVIFSDELSQYLQTNGIDAKLKTVPSTFFCPKSCKNSPGEYACCDIETFHREWFEPGTDYSGLIGKCKTDAKACAILVDNHCAELQESKESGLIA
jgi:hypothetical protein